MISGDNLIPELNIVKSSCRKVLLSKEEDVVEEAILNTLSREGTLSLTKLVKTIENYGGWEAKRNSIKRRIDGQENHPSLIDYEFIKERKPEKRKPGKYGKEYCLTTKGFLASLATKHLSFDRTYMFKKYVTFLDNYLDDKIKHIGNDADFDSTLDIETKNMLLDVITNYIKNQITVFLIWHEANEISIRKRRKVKEYIEDFISTHNEYIHQEFPMMLDKKQEEEYRHVLRKYFESSKILHSLIELPTDDTHSKKINIKLKMISSFVFKWYLYFDELQMKNPIGEDYNIRNTHAGVLSRPEYGIDIEYYGMFGHKRKIQPDLKLEAENKVQQILKKKISITDIWRNPMRKELIGTDWLYV